MPSSEEFWRATFASFAERKTSAATHAVTPPYLTVTETPAPGLIPLATPWSARGFGGAFYISPVPALPVPTCSLIFVQSLEGNTVASDVASLGGGQTDFHVVYEGLSRVAADAVLVGSGTLGARTMFSVWHPEMVAERESSGLPRHPVQIVATSRGVDPAKSLLFNIPEVPVIVLTTSAGATVMKRSLRARPWLRLVVTSTPGDLADAFKALRAEGIRRISCVGGRTLARQLLALNLIDDLYLTTSPLTGGEPDSSLGSDAMAGAVIVSKQGTGQETSVRFEHRHFPRTVP